MIPPARYVPLESTSVTLTYGNYTRLICAHKYLAAVQCFLWGGGQVTTVPHHSKVIIVGEGRGVAIFLSPTLQ